MKSWIIEILRHIDVGINVFFLFGDSSESISMRVARAIYGPGEAKDWVYVLADLIDLLFHNLVYSLEKDHVEKAFSPEVYISHDYWKWVK